MLKQVRYDRIFILVLSLFLLACCIKKLGKNKDNNRNIGKPAKRINGHKSDFRSNDNLSETTAESEVVLKEDNTDVVHDDARESDGDEDYDTEGINDDDDDDGSMVGKEDFEYDDINDDQIEDETTEEDDGDDEEEGSDPIPDNPSVYRSASISGCRGQVPIQPYRDQFENQIFLMETSGKSKLGPRQACAVESAARATGLPVIMLLASDHVNIEDKMTCHLYKNVPGVHFHKLAPEIVFEGTPLKPLYERGDFHASKHSATHFSEAYRISYLYKYGGWYADLDFLFLKDLSHLPANQSLLAATWGRRDFDHLTGCIMHLPPKHPVLEKYFELFSETFDPKGDRPQAGPPMLTKSVRMLCNLTEDFHLTELTDPSRCHNLEIAHPNKFIRVTWLKTVDKLWTKYRLTPKQWDSFFGPSQVIHFFSSRTDSKLVLGNVLHEAYSNYGPKMCPLSFPWIIKEGPRRDKYLKRVLGEDKKSWENFGGTRV